MHLDSNQVCVKNSLLCIDDLFKYTPIAEVNLKLTILDLSWNGAGLLAAKAIFELLKKNSTLEKLHLNNEAHLNFNYDNELSFNVFCERFSCVLP